MNSLNLKIIFLLIMVSSIAYAEDPFSRSFSSPTSSSSTVDLNLGSGSNENDGIHPMVRYDVSKYYIKGVITSESGSLAIVSLPGDKDYFLFLGDPLGNDLHTIKNISQDFVVVSKSNGEDVSINVLNPIQGMNGL
jgi:type II secretory pathway component PulC